MAIIRWDPFTEVARLRRELDSFFGQASAGWMPAADVERDADGVKVSIDLPGMKAEDVKVEVRDQYLVISGNRETDREEKSEGTYTRERTFGSFARSFALPAGVDADDVKARFENGELTVMVALPAEPEAKTIEIEVETPTAVAV